ncbi:hypothetical protein [Hymenobacter sp. BT190]|uniref:hypothetical protein n=1 Tax=Hymenobacter sp. BT190 TaxID=2763505 RepID=UPI0016516B83|nr:hypothetical protein [Hymenobacter sp. BT190]MBC6698145.1 hypothetical protein [Hymenobacter sp. BT190]
MTPDSWNYLGAAQSVATTGQLRNANGTLYTAWPPLFPVVLAGWKAVLPFGWKWLQGTCLAASLLLWGRLGQQLLTHPALIRLYILVLAFSTPWLMCGGFLWSEPLFILLLSGYLYALYCYSRNGTATMLLCATVCGILLPLQRVTGFFVLAGVGLSVVALYPVWAWRRRWLLVGHELLTVGAGAVWQYYTLVVAAARNLQEIQGWNIWVQAATDFGHAMGRWLMPLTTYASQGYGLYAVLFLLLTTGGLMVPGPRFLRLLGIMVPVVLLPLVPLAWLGQSGAGLTDADRYTAVLYAPFFLLLFAQAQQVLASQSPKRQRLMLLLGFCWLLYPAARTIRNSIFLHNHPSAFAATKQ